MMRSCGFASFLAGALGSYEENAGMLQLQRSHDSLDCSKGGCKPGGSTTPVSCCKAMEASCLACQQDVTVDEFCATNIGYRGCPIIEPVCVANNDDPCRHEECVDGFLMVAMQCCLIDCGPDRYVPPAKDQCCGSCEKKVCEPDNSDPCIEEFCDGNGDIVRLAMACALPELCANGHGEIVNVPGQCCPICEKKKCEVDNSDPCVTEGCDEFGNKWAYALGCPLVMVHPDSGITLHFTPPKPDECCGTWTEVVCCEADNAVCNSCRADQTVDEYCKDHHEEIGCPGYEPPTKPPCVPDLSNPCIIEYCDDHTGDKLVAHIDCQREMMGPDSCNGHWEEPKEGQCCATCVEKPPCVADNSDPCLHEVCDPDGNKMIAIIDCPREMGMPCGRWEEPKHGECCAACVAPACKEENKDPCCTERCHPSGEKEIMCYACFVDCAAQGRKYEPPKEDECCGKCTELIDERDQWTLVFRQTLPFLFKKDQWRLNAHDDKAENYAILDQLDDYKYNKNFWFKMVWPKDKIAPQMWKQESNPVANCMKGKTHSVKGYEATNGTAHSSSYWGGLECSGQTYSLLDGSVNHNNWYYAVGSFRKWSNGIPGPQAAAQQMELYVRTVGTPPPVCCKAMTASCLACGQGVSVVEYCLSNLDEDVAGCEDAGAGDQWTLMLRQTMSYLYKKNEFRKNSRNPKNDNYAVLDELKHHEIDGKYFFKLEWPKDNLLPQIWSQTSNPVKTCVKGKKHKVDGYQALNEAHTSNRWGGLECSGQTYSLLDGTVNHGNWYYAVGSFQKWGSGIPGPSKAVKQVELYVRSSSETRKKAGQVVYKVAVQCDQTVRGAWNSQVWVKTNGLSFGFVIHPGYTGTAARFEGAFSKGNQNIGWTLNPNVYHTIKAVFRKNGKHTMTIIDGQNGKTWSQDFTNKNAYGDGIVQVDTKGNDQPDTTMALGKEYKLNKRGQHKFKLLPLM